MKSAGTIVKGSGIPDFPTLDLTVRTEHWQVMSRGPDVTFIIYSPSPTDLRTLATEAARLADVIEAMAVPEAKSTAA